MLIAGTGTGRCGASLFKFGSVAVTVGVDSREGVLSWIRGEGGVTMMNG